MWTPVENAVRARPVPFVLQMAKKRQTFGKIQRERERAEKRAQKLEKKEERKAQDVARREAEALGIPWVEPEQDEGENWNSPTYTGEVGDRPAAG